MLLIFLGAWLAGFAWYCADSLTMRPQNIEESTDAIVVLTGGGKRVETGLELFARGRSKNLFISGVYAGVTKQEIGRMWTGTPVLPECCIILGCQAHSTIDNAQETAAWVSSAHYTSLRLVTANYHMKRAMLELSRAMPGVKIIPHPVVQPDLKILSLRFLVLMLSEYHKTSYRAVSFLFLNPRTPSDTDLQCIKR